MGKFLTIMKIRLQNERVLVLGSAGPKWDRVPPDEDTTGCDSGVGQDFTGNVAFSAIRPTPPSNRSQRLTKIIAAGRQLAQNNHQGLPCWSPVCISVRPIRSAAKSSTIKEGGGKGRHANPISSGSRLASCSGRTWRSLKTRADKELRCRVQLPQKGSNDRSRQDVGQPTPLN